MAEIRDWRVSHLSGGSTLFASACLTRIIRQDAEEHDVEEWCVQGGRTHDTKVPGPSICSHVSAVSGPEAVDTSDLKVLCALQ